MSIKVLFTPDEIQARVKKLADAIRQGYSNESNILLVGVLNGAMQFSCDLSKYLTSDIQMDFIKLSSYGNKTTSSGEVKEIFGLSEKVIGKDVIIVEDIIDTGHTMEQAIKIFRNQHPKSIKICALLNKPSRREVKDLTINYLGFEIPDCFVVGYGLDFEGHYRNLPYIGEVVGLPINN